MSALGAAGVPVPRLIDLCHGKAGVPVPRLIDLCQGKAGVSVSRLIDLCQGTAVFFSPQASMPREGRFSFPRLIDLLLFFLVDSVLFLVSYFFLGQKCFTCFSS